MSQVTLRQWTDVVRRARLGRTVKAVAMVLATYADANGQRVFPGVARLAWECEINYNTAQQALAKLREVELIELVRKSGTKGAKRREADEYRLILGEGLLEHVEVPTPAQAEVAMNKIRRSKQGRYRDESHPSAQGAVEDGSHPSGVGAVEGRSHPSAREHDLPIAPIGAMQNDAIAPIGASSSHPSALGPNTHDRDTSTNSHSGEELGTTSHGPRARAAETNTEFDADVIDLEARRATLSPSRCVPHGLPAARCTFCRRAVGDGP